MKKDELLEGLKTGVIQGDKNKTREFAQMVIDEEFNPLIALTEGLVVGIDVVGEQFSKGEIFLPELVMSARALKGASSILEKKIEEAGLEKKTLGTVVIGTVQGDVHDIGKTIVATLLSANGFNVYDLGTDVSVDQFIQAARDQKADIVGMSALLTTTMMYMAKVISALKEAGLPVKVMVGGGPVEDPFAEEIGADGCGFDAADAVKVAKQLVSG